MGPDSVVFLVDVDNTLLDNDGVQADLKRHLEENFGAACRLRYWTILEALFAELGYRDYLGALQRYRAEHPEDIRLLAMSSWLVDYPFADRLHSGALQVLARFRGWGETVILSDGDVVFPERSNARASPTRCAATSSFTSTKSSSLQTLRDAIPPRTTSWWTTSPAFSLR